jgi:hypothetical protein
LAARGAAASKGRTAASGTAALAARGFSRVGASVGGLFRIALSARGSSQAGGAAAPRLVASLSARGTSLSSGGAGFSGIVGLKASGFVAATGRLISSFLGGGNLTANPRFTIKLGLPIPQGPDFSVMDVGETVTGAIDFAKWLPSGVTIASIVSVTATNSYPGGGSSYVTLSGAAKIGTAPMAIGGSGVANAAVLQQWLGVAPGVARIAATITTSDGQTLIGWSHQPVGQPC